MIYLDTCLVICAIEADGETATAVLTALERTDEQIAVSPLVLMECLVGPLRSGNETVVDTYERFCETVVTLALTTETFRAAARLRAEFGLKAPDAIHLAAARMAGCSALWTNDHRLARAAGDFAVNVLDAAR